MTERESIKILRECIELQEKKGADYQSKASTVRQADYYRLGVDSIYDMMHTKMLRLMSLMETAKAGGSSAPNFESLEDTAKDLINYSSFFAAYIRGGVDGQDPNKDMFNRPIESPKKEEVADIVAATVKYIESDTSPVGPSLLNVGYPDETIIRKDKTYFDEDREWFRDKKSMKVPMNVVIDPVPGVTHANSYTMIVKESLNPYNRRTTWPVYDPVQPAEEDGDKDWPDNVGH